MAAHLSIESQLIELLQRSHPNADFKSFGRLDRLLTVLMYELARPGVVPESVFKAIRTALKPQKKAGTGIHRTLLREIVRKERSADGSWPELAAMPEDRYIADASRRLMLPEDTVRNFIHGKRGKRKTIAKKRRGRARQ